MRRPRPAAARWGGRFWIQAADVGAAGRGFGRRAERDGRRRGRACAPVSLRRGGPPPRGRPDPLRRGPERQGRAIGGGHVDDDEVDCPARPRRPRRGGTPLRRGLHQSDYPWAGALRCLDAWWKFRPLGIPCLRDRVAQTAAMLVLSPIFEADLQPEQYAYRPGRNARDAVRRVHRRLTTGHREVVDGDLSDYFGQIRHAELLRSIARRVSDRRLLGWVKAWLEMVVDEDDGRGGRRRTNRARRERRGTPQGAPMTPRTQRATFGSIG